MWVEINSRVNYPIKTCLVALQQNGDIDLDCSHQKYCISWFTLRVANVGTTLAVQSWNDHPIPGIPLEECMYYCGCITIIIVGRGVPNILMRSNNHAQHVDEAAIYSPETAVQAFQSAGGHLTIFSEFGEDPLSQHAELVAQREAEFQQRYSDFSQFFYTVVNNDYSLFKEGLLFLIELSKGLQSLQ